MTRKIRWNRIILLLVIAVFVVLISVFTIDKIRFNAFVNEANSNYMLIINEKEYHPSMIKGKDFIFSSYDHQEIDLQVPKNSTINLLDNYKLTNENNEEYSGNISYLPDGKYFLTIEKGGFTYEYDLIVNNDFYVEIDSSKAVRAGWFVVDFFDLDEGEEVEIQTSFNSSEYFIFRDEDMIIPIAYDNVDGGSQISFSSSKSSTSPSVNIETYEFREDHFNVDQTVVDSASVQPDEQMIEYYNDANNSKNEVSMYDSTGFKTPALGYTTGDYGDVRYINGATTPTKIHNGIDYAAPKDSPVYAVADGIVSFATFLPSTGNTVVVDHGNGITSHYFHLNSIDVVLGSAVTHDSLIGGIGTTGFSTGDHLHLEVHINGMSVNPHLLLDQELNF